MRDKSLLKILSGVLVAGLMVSCMGMEDVDPSSLSRPEVETFKVKDNGSLMFELSATISKSAASRVAECGFYYGKDKSMSGAEKVECKMLGGTFSADITLHEYGETFYACSYISNGVEGNEICSDPKSITVKGLQDYVEFGQAALVFYDRATKAASVSVSYEVKEGVEVTARGLCYGTSRDLSVKGNNLKDADLSSGSVTYEIPEIEAGKPYYVRPYLYDGDDLAYGQVQELHAYAVPLVEIGEVSEVNSDCASVSCEVVYDCGKAIKSRGVVYVKGDGEPTLRTGKSAVPGTTGEYTVTLSGLSPNTLYSVRAYAENEKGVAYSAEKRTFTTSVALPRVTVSVGDKTSSSANVTGNITSDGGEAPSEVGFYYGLSEDVDLMTSIQVSGVLSGSSFSTELKGLTRATKYYVRAYAVNSAGEAVSTSVSFSTITESPRVVTGEVSDIKDESALFSGSIPDNGGAEITDKGFVWSTRSNPNINSCEGSYNCGSGCDDFQHAPVLKPATIYFVRAYARNSDSYIYGEERKFVTTGDPKSMSPANCFIVSKSGIYAFKTVKGNSNESVGEVASVDVLWETFGTSIAPSVGDLVKAVRLGKGCVVFETADTYKEGNAVIAVRDSNGEILWSWHIWFTDQPKNCVYADNAGTMMDRNLGATSATPGDVGALGLLYQWGRKDPFLGSSSIDVSIEAISTITWPATVYSSSYYGTIDYAIKNPTTFITGNTNNYDWEYNGSYTRWDATKTIYDPCPDGWHVPDGDVWSNIGLQQGDSDYYDRDNCGIMLKNQSEPNTWYPAAGCKKSYETITGVVLTIEILDGKLGLVDTHGRYWSASRNGKQSYYLYFHCSGYLGPEYTTYRADAQSVRCLQE